MSKFIKLISEKVYAKSGLGRWFNDESATKEPGWDRYDSSGKRVGKCGDAKEGSSYSACLSKQKANRLGKKKIASFVKRKRVAQKRSGRGKKGAGGKGMKPIFVNTGINENTLTRLILERKRKKKYKNKATDPELWARAVAAAREKFDVYPSAYANAWASKWYKERGGGWTKIDESVQSPEWALYHKPTGKFIKSEDPETGELMPSTFDKKSEATAELEMTHASNPELQIVKYNEKMEKKGMKPIKEETTRKEDKPFEDQRKKKKKRENENRKKSVSLKGKSNLKEKLSFFYSNLLEKTAAWQRKEGKDPEGGLNRKGVESYRRENPGSKLQMAVTTKPSKLKKGSKRWKRRRSFCARMGGMKGAMKKPNGEPTRKALALRKWNCESHTPKNGTNLKLILEKCWAGYKQDGFKKKGNKSVPNCVKMYEEIVNKHHKGKMTPAMKKSRDKCAKGKLPNIKAIVGNDTIENAKHRYCTSVEWKKHYGKKAKDKKK